MNIIVDAMGGDNAPLAILQGAALAVREYGVTITAVGREETINALVKQHGIDMTGIAVVHAEDAIAMTEDATDVRKRKGSSLMVALDLLAKGGGEAFVSAGSTGAVLVGATIVAKRIKGIKRAALGTVIPGAEKPWMLIDIGANAECRPEQLVQFAAMGSAYMEKVMGVASPAVGLANNGAEETKGTSLQLGAYPLLQNSGLRFVGNVEGRDLMAGAADVVVCDGFSGNLILKTIEGVAKTFSGKLKEMFYASAKTKVAGLLVKSGLDGFKRSFDYKEYGGAPFLGIRHPVIKAHGSSDARAFKNAIRQAKQCAEKDVAGAIENWIATHKLAGSGDD